MNEFIQNCVKYLRYSPGVLALIVIPVVLSLGLMTIPVFRDFDYEFNAVLGIVYLIVSVVIMIRTRQSGLGPTGDPVGQIGVEIRKSNLYIFKLNLTAVFLSLFASLITAIAFTAVHCSLIRGVQFFLLLPVTSALIGSGFGYLIAAVFSRFAWIAAILILFLSVAVNLIWVEQHVPIYVYSVFWGYFPGPIYDEWIPVTSVLLVHRLWSLLFAFVFVVVALMWKSRPKVPTKYLYSFVAILALIFGIYEMRFKLRFDSGYDEVRTELGAEYRSENVTLISDKELNQEEIKWMLQLAEFYYGQITGFLDLTKQRSVTVYVYKDEYQKKQLMGAGRTNFAKIFNDEIHINFEDVESVLKHEMTHVLANDFGNRYYGTGRIGFLEGTAVACEWNENYFTPHEWAAALKKQNKLPDVISLIEPAGFFSSASGLSYTVSGSFTRFLIDSYGISSFKRAYYHEDIQSVYGLTARELSERWKLFLDSVIVTEEDVKLAGILIQPSLFQKCCPHYVADILEEAAAAYEQGSYTVAERIFKKALFVDKENYRILMPIIRSRYYAGDFASTLRDVDSLLASGAVNYLSRASLGLLKGDIFLMSGKKDSAFDQYSDVARTFKNISSVYLAAKLRMELVHHEKTDVLQNLVRSPDVGKQEGWIEQIVNDDPENKIYKFWLTRLKFQRADFRGVSALWINREESVPDTSMEFERLKMLAESRMRLSEYDASKENWKTAGELARRKMDREYIEQRLLLLDWLARRSN